MISKIKSLFETPKKAVVTTVCTLAIMAVAGSSAAYAAESIAKSSAIGGDNAQNFAFADAGIDPAEAKVTNVEFDFEMGQFVYEVEFIYNGTEYDYWIKSSNGTVLKKEVEIKNLQGQTVVASAKVSLEDAKKKALEDAGVKEADVQFGDKQLDVDDGVTVYDISFYTGNAEYEYEINADTGEIYSKSVEKYNYDRNASAPAQEESVAADNNSQPASSSSSNTSSKPSGSSSSSKPSSSQPASNASSSSSSGSSSSSESGSSKIGLDKAKSIACKKAGLSVGSVKFTKAKYDRDDGVPVYEIEFRHDGYEYDVDVHATSGKILDYDKERDDD